MRTIPGSFYFSKSSIVFFIETEVESENISAPSTHRSRHGPAGRSFWDRRTRHLRSRRWPRVDVRDHFHRRRLEDWRVIKVDML